MPGPEENRIWVKCDIFGLPEFIGRLKIARTLRNMFNLNKRPSQHKVLWVITYDLLGRTIERICTQHFTQMLKIMYLIFSFLSLSKYLLTICDLWSIDYNVTGFDFDNTDESTDIRQLSTISGCMTYRTYWYRFLNLIITDIVKNKQIQ